MKYIFIIVLALTSLFPKTSRSQWTNTFWPVDIQCFGSIGSKIYAGATLIVSNDSGLSWVSSNSLAQGSNVFATKGTFFFVGNNGNILRSTDSGSSWKEVFTGSSSRPVYVLCSNDSFIFASIVGLIYRSSDNGLSWILPGDSSITGIVHDFVSIGKILFAGTYSKGIFRSTNNGGHWDAILPDTAYLSQSNWYITSSGSTLYATASQTSSFFMSIDSGTTWRKYNMGHFGFDIGAESSIVAIGSTIFVGYVDPIGGITQSSDSGKTWSTVGNMDRVNSLFIFGNYIFAGTNNTGIYRARLSDFGVDAVYSHPSIISKFTILSNPITSSTSFQFDALQESAVFELFDLLGRSLLRQQLPAGQAALHIDMQKYPAGIYFARLGAETLRFIKM